MAKKRARVWRRLRRWLLMVSAAAVGLSVVSTLALRWVPPPTTAFILERRIEALIDGTSYSVQRRWVPLEAISGHAGVAVIAAEDQKFPTHWGFDTESIADAIEERQRGGRVRGASTISQQVAKNLFLWPGRSFLRKGLEVYWTVLIELLWPKQRILEVYLNVAELGPGVFGVEAASQRFFRKPARRLEPAEAALLAAVLPNPLRLHADRPSAYVLERQQWILQQMDQLGSTTLLRSMGVEAATAR